MDEQDMMNKTFGETEDKILPEVKENITETPVAESSVTEEQVFPVAEGEVVENAAPAVENVTEDSGLRPEESVSGEGIYSEGRTPQQSFIDISELESDPQYQTVNVPYPPKKKSGTGKWLIIMGVALLLTISYSVIQTVYIYKLNTGSEGIMSYIPGLPGRKDPGETKPSGKPDQDKPATSYEPWFSLEAATTDYSDAKRLSTTDIAKTVAPSTVSILIYENVNGKDTATSAGTGFIITKDGYIVTNAHVVEEVSKSDKTIKVKVPEDKDPYEAKIIGMDNQTDVAVIKIEAGKDLPVVSLGNSDLLEPGELIVVIGNALGTLDGTVTAGVVSALEREIHNNGYTIPVIQTDAAINSGNSGGPMINSYGQVVGITNAKMVSGTAEGLGFGIPINRVRTVIESIINYGKVINRPFLGMTLSYVEEGAYYGVEPGIYVTDMIQDGPAVKSGMEIGDKVLTFDGVEISVPSDIIGIRDSHNVGDQVDVVIVRDRQQQTIRFTIGDSGDYEDKGNVSDLPGQDKDPFGRDDQEPTEPSDPTTNPDGSEPSGDGTPRGLDIFGDK